MCLYFLGKSLPFYRSILSFVLFSYLPRLFLFYLFCVATTTAHSILGTVTLWFVQEECVLCFLGFHNNIQHFADLS